MITDRAANWPALLDAFVEARRHAPFKWGEHDCCLFAADWVRECRGFDPAEKLRGYTTALGAMRRVRLLGDTVEDLPAALGFEPVAAAHAARGDMVSVQTDTGPAIAICLATHIVAPGPECLTFLPRNRARKAWRV